MDQLLWVLRAITPRNIVLGLLLLGTVYAGIHYQHIPRRAYRQWRYPPSKAAPDPAIASVLDKRESNRVIARYRKVSALIEESRANGFAVDGLAAKARAALALNRPGYRDDALRVLGELEMHIPRKRVQYIPMNEQPLDEAAWPGEQPQRIGGSEDPAPKPKAQAKRKRRRR